MKSLTQERLRELLHYDPETGVFTWLDCQNRHGNFKSSGAKAGHDNSKGYLEIRFDGGHVKAHRLAWFWVYHEWPVGDIDHINGVKSDNRIANLRKATRSQNNANARLSSHNTSGFKGVYWHKGAGKWMAYIKVLGRRKHLGLFIEKEDAHAAYSNAARDAFGEFARTE